MNVGIFRNVDIGLLVPVFILIIISLSTLISIDSNLFKSQLIFFGFSLLVFLLFTQVNYLFINAYSVPIYAISIFLLIILFLIGIESRGAVRWIDILGIRIQFSEILKPFLAVSLASFLSDRQFNFRSLFLTMGFLLPIIILITIQPDLGNALVYLGATILTLLIAGFSIRWFIAGLIFFVAFIPLVWNFFHEYQKQRILTFLDPAKDPLGSSYNTIQSVIAVGSGIFLGKGLSETTQSTLKFLPEHHTDFIFAAISEGLGFLGSAIIIISFAFLLFKIYTIFLATNEKFCKIFLTISFSTICIQFFVNIGMNIGILPVVGITLPFVSYGGSSLLSNFIFLALISSMSSNLKNREVLEIR